MKRFSIRFLAMLILVLLFSGSVMVSSAETPEEVTLQAEAKTGKVTLTWTVYGGGETTSVRIFRDTVQDFSVEPENNLLINLPASSGTYDDYTVEGRKKYYYKVQAVNNLGMMSNLSNEVEAEPLSINPHARKFYTMDTNVCDFCHLPHSGSGINIIRQKETVTLCISCHKPGGQSIYDVETALVKTGSKHLSVLDNPGGMKCADCHNSHGDKNQLTGEVYSRLLKTTINGSIYYKGIEFCLSCHPAKSAVRGTGHDADIMKPPTGTGITCVACHDKHASSNPKLLRELIAYSYGGGSSPENTYVNGNTKEFCYGCHSRKRADLTRSDYAWNGKGVNEVRGHNQDCKVCHESHGTANPRQLRNTYDINYSAVRSIAYQAEDFQTCFTGGCHNAANLTNTTEPEKTGFYNKGGVSGEQKNLHYYHLVRLGEENRGNAVCKECHRPHGAIKEENPTFQYQVGFPADTVAANVYAMPVYTLNPGGQPGGSCNLTCHGTNHNDSNGSLYLR